jgi:hypothetical protein
MGGGGGGGGEQYLFLVLVILQLVFSEASNKNSGIPKIFHVGAIYMT